LFFHAERRNFGEGCRLNPANSSGKLSLSAPMLDHHLSAGANFDCVGAQNVNDYFEIARIPNLQQWRAGLDDGFAFLSNFQHDTGNRRCQVPAFGLQVGTIAIPSQHGLRAD
jgi:hypothetical protein